jgi:hypothetical protein
MGLIYLETNYQKFWGYTIEMSHAVY